LPSSPQSLREEGLALQSQTSCLLLPGRGSALAAHVLCALPPFRSACWTDQVPQSIKR